MPPKLFAKIKDPHGPKVVGDRERKTLVYTAQPICERYSTYSFSRVIVLD